MSFAISLFKKVLGSRFDSLLLDDEVRHVFGDTVQEAEEGSGVLIDSDMENEDYDDVENSSNEANDEEEEDIEEEDVEDSILNT